MPITASQPCPLVQDWNLFQPQLSAFLAQLYLQHSLPCGLLICTEQSGSLMAGTSLEDRISQAEALYLLTSGYRRFFGKRCKDAAQLL